MSLTASKRTLLKFTGFFDIVKTHFPHSRLYTLYIHQLIALKVIILTTNIAVWIYLTVYRDRICSHKCHSNKHTQHNKHQCFSLCTPVFRAVKVRIMINTHNNTRCRYTLRFAARILWYFCRGRIFTLLNTNSVPVSSIAISCLMRVSCLIPTR